MSDATRVAAPQRNALERSWERASKVDPRYLIALLITLVLVAAQLRYHMVGGYDRLALALAVCTATEALLSWFDPPTILGPGEAVTVEDADLAAVLAASEIVPTPDGPRRRLQNDARRAALKRMASRAAMREVLEDEDREDTSERRVREAERRADVVHVERRVDLVARGSCPRDLDHAVALQARLGTDLVRTQEDQRTAGDLDRFQVP